MSEYVSHRVNITFDEFGCKAEFDCSEFVDRVSHEVERRITREILDRNAELLGNCGYLKVDFNSCWFANFGTPERAAQTIIDTCCYDCKACPFSSTELIMGNAIPCKDRYGCEQVNYDEILAWLKGGCYV